MQSSKRQLTLSQGSANNSAESVVYVMSRDQRVQDNHALLAAQREALDKELPLVVVFNLLPKAGVRSQEHFSFMLDGLEQVANDLEKLGIHFVLLFGDASENIPQIAEQIQSATIYFDFNPINGIRKVQKQITEAVSSRCVVVDTHNVIPLWELSGKEEFAAHTIRGKVHKKLEEWLVEPGMVEKHPHSFNQELESLSFKEAKEKISSIKQSGINLSFESGEKAANKRLEEFIGSNLKTYGSERNDPVADAQTDMSPYLHFGQISALRVALRVLEEAPQRPLLFDQGKLASFEGEPTKMDSINALLEELIVRKELADNYCFYNENYDNLAGAKPWAIETLEQHKGDPREYTYSPEEWEKAKTHDAAWNAAQKQMMKTGKMHGYMRMYWAKKILEWSASPEEAIKTCVYLNDHYSIDGGDPNGYTGIMWSIAGVHDRPWFERDVYGKIRYMNEGGLKRKFDLNSYIEKWTA